MDDPLEIEDTGTIVAFMIDAGLHDADNRAILSPAFTGRVKTEALVEVINILQSNEVI